MKAFIGWSASLAHIVSSALAISSGLDALTIQDLATAANNSLFEKWRPTYHFIGPNSWQNDPCAPYYDQVTETYHMFYQYHAQHVQWGNISWGHATSRDMVTWTDVASPNIPGSDVMRPLAFTPASSDNSSYDRLGVFSGGAIPDGKGGWAILYTGVQKLPTNWRLPYLQHTENVLLATTSDHGKTWHKRDRDPVISSPSDYWNITGWRDPLAVYEADLLRETVFTKDWHGTAYVTLGSGLKGDDNVAGRVLMYHTVDPHAEHLTKWEYLGPLFQAKANYSWDNDQGWSGNFGNNFEMSGMMALYPEDGSDSPTWAVHIGVEGLFFGSHAGLVVLGNVTNNNNTEHGYMSPSAVAVGDWGATYAYNHFLAPASKKGGRDRRILTAWLPEAWNTNANFSGSAFGYQGSLILPRELFIKSTAHVTSSTVTQKGSWWSTMQDDGKHTVHTLGVRPASELETLRKGATHYTLKPNKPSAGQTTSLAVMKTTSYELRMSIGFGSSNASAGIVLRASNTTGEQTVITYNLATESLSIDRNKSSLLSFSPHAPTGSAGYIANYEEHGKLRLWEVDGKRQTLDLTIYVDNSLVEVYANDVFVLATRIYPWADDANGVQLFANGSDINLSEVQIWDGLASAWPRRSDKTSLPLVYDGSGEPWDGR